MNNESQMPILDESDEVSIQRKAWWATMVMYRTLPLRVMDEELRDETGIDVATYDALMVIVKAQDQGVRMTDLARDVFMSKSGLTAVVDRLEERGLLRRVPDPDDRRAIRIMLTDEGFETARNAAEVHLAGIEKYFGDRVTDAEAEVIRDVMERVTPDPASSNPAPH